MTARTMGRWLPLLLIVIVFTLSIYYQWYQYLSFATLQQHEQQLRLWIQQYYMIVVVCYMLIYIFTVAVSIPGATLLTMSGGFLFGIALGIVYVVISATVGACLIFLSVKLALGPSLGKKATPWLKFMEEGFDKNEANYLLFLRLVPLVPFWAINIGAALLNVRGKVFFWVTLFGIIPGSLVYVAAGNGLQAVFASGREPNLDIIFNPEIFLPLLGLGLLALIPVLYRWYKNRKASC